MPGAGLPRCVARAYTRGEKKGKWIVATWICVEFQQLSRELVEPCAIAGVMSLREKGAHKGGVDPRWFWNALKPWEEIEGAAPLRRKRPDEDFADEIVSYASPLAMLHDADGLQELVVVPTIAIADGELSTAGRILTGAGVSLDCLDPEDWRD